MEKINKTVEENPGLKEVLSNRMKLTRKAIRQQIIAKAGTVCNDGYVAEIKDNLVPTVLEEDFIDDLTNGAYSAL